MTSVKCLNCKFSTTDEDELLDHVVIHLHEATFGIKCMRCPQVSTSRKIGSHKKHIKKCKEDLLAIKNPTQQKKLEENTDYFFWKCQICSEIVQLRERPNIKDFEFIATHCYKHTNVDGIVPLCPICGKQYQVKNINY